MLKKILFTLLILLNAMPALAASNNKPKYKLSDSNAKKYWVEMGKLAQCVNPNLSDPTQKMVLEQYKHRIIHYIIGEKNYQTLNSDVRSIEYMKIAIDKANDALAKENFLFPQLSTSDCNQLKQEFNNQVYAWQIRQQPTQQNFYSTPQGQAYLAQQQLIQQQQQIIEQQRMERERQEKLRAWQDLGNTIQQSAQSLTNTLNNNTQMMNNMSNQIQMNNQQMMQNWGGSRGGSINCYNLGSITRCNY